MPLRDTDRTQMEEEEATTVTREFYWNGHNLFVHQLLGVNCASGWVSAVQFTSDVICTIVRRRPNRMPNYTLLRNA